MIHTMTMGLRCLTVLALLLGAGDLSAARLPARPAAPRPDVRLLRTPDGGVQPQAVVDAEGTLHVVYLKGTPEACDVYYARRRAGKTEFTTSLRVNSQPGSAVAVGAVRGAQLALGRPGQAHVAWNGSNQARPAGRQGPPMLYARLNDAGDGFEAQRNLMTTTAGLDGGGSVAADTKGNVFVAWHGLPPGSAAGDQNRAVFLARSTDEGETFAPERQVSPKGTGACGGCALKTFVDVRGRLYVLYRAATGGTGRDITLLVSRDAGLVFTNLVLDRWQTATCPASSLDLAQGFGDTLSAAWDREGKIQIVTLVPDMGGNGVAGFPPVGQGNRKHPAVALQEQRGQRLVEAWTEDTGPAKGGSVAWRLIDFSNGSVKPGRAPGVPAGSRIAAVADADGGFTILY